MAFCCCICLQCEIISIHGTQWATETGSTRNITNTSRIPVEEKSAECLICMKYRIIILIIIIISLGQIFYRILQTHHACTHIHARIHARAHTRARTHAHTCTHTAAAAVTVRRTGYRYSVSPNRDGPLRLRQCRSLAIQITTPTGDPITPIFWMFFAYKKHC